MVSANRILREAVAEILNRSHDIEVVGAARNCREAIAEISHKLPDVVLLNPTTSTSCELLQVQGICQRLPKPKIVAFGVDDSEQAFLAAVRAGVVGYLVKDACGDDVVAGVRAAVRGEVTWPPRLCLSLLTEFATRARSGPVLALGTNVQLTRREQDLIPLIAQGLTNKEIATVLNLSAQTVKNHVHRILQKSELNSRGAILARFQPSGARVEQGTEGPRLSPESKQSG